MKFYTLLISIIILFFTTTCGKVNIFERRAPANLQEKAELDMEQKNYDVAQGKLERILAEDSTNYTARSLLAASHAAQAGITLLGIAQKAMEKSTESNTNETDNGGINALSKLMPSASSDTELTHMKIAVELMGENFIPLNELTAEMRYQKGVFNSIYAVMLINILVNDPTKLLTIKVEDAQQLIGLITTAIITFESENTLINNTLTEINTELEAASGADAKEKLQTFIANNAHK